MTCVVVNDASCLIDLRKGGLLGVLGSLSYRFIVPLPIRTFELIDFTEQDWESLDETGMVTYDLTSEEVEEAFALKSRHPSLSANDCFCIVTARVHAGILLTGDSYLRRVATERGLLVHGVLWIVDRLFEVAQCDNSVLINALGTWREDATVFLPREELLKRLHRHAPDTRS